MHAPSPDSFFPREISRPRYRPGLHRFACFCAGAVLFLICVGGVVTSKNAGMSVPDWPTTYGYNMFYFPWQDWVGGIFWEHSHRLDASGVGLLIILLALWLCFQERVWLRWMGGAAVILVILQGVIGGLRVIWMMDWLGIPHALLAQSFFVFVSLIALFTSRWWMEARSGQTPPQWTGRTLAVCALIFAQLLIGATMRHEHAGLSIDDFPLAYGQIWPKTDPVSMARYNLDRLAHNEMATTPFYVNLQMIHRLGAVLITVAILAVAAAMWLKPGTAAILRRWSSVWVGLVLMQFALGACTIWTNKAADVATAHVAMGALTLTLGVLLTAISWRLQSLRDLATRGAA
ncbi:MAG TPA: COX15/CtaA family protein [Candidatus Methylacidiphilales bacterium]|nr:COX15/CtaA family protein [Candidatus Methylacidiphilales bacterium]